MFLEKDEMKFAILYTLRQYSHPLSVSRLIELLIWDENVMSHFDLMIMLGELIEDKFIERLYYREEECVKLTGRGTQTDDFFRGRVPSSIRKRIKEVAARENFDEISNPNGIIGEIIPSNGGRYMASLLMLDSGSPMMELKIDVGHRLQATRAAKILKNNADEIYKYICKTLDESE